MTNIEAMKLALDALENDSCKENAINNAIAALRQAISEAEQAEQEPVAWMFQPPDKRISPMFDVMAHGGKWQPLYTAPPQREWVSLTDDEKMDSYCDLPGFRQYVAAYFAGAEWAEAKLKEKNK